MQLDDPSGILSGPDVTLDGTAIALAAPIGPGLGAGEHTLVVSAVDGLEKRFVHYLEAQGYIHPTKIQKARIARRDYSPADLERIRGIWRYYQRGISVQRAYDSSSTCRSASSTAEPAPASRSRKPGANHRCALAATKEAVPAARTS